jgi:hypothetical protein
VSWAFDEEDDDLLSGLPGCCPGCQLPWTSCVCSTPWSKVVTPAYYFALTEPPAFWRKKDRDEWRHQVAMSWQDIKEVQR